MNAKEIKQAEKDAEEHIAEMHNRRIDPDDDNAWIDLNDSYEQDALNDYE